MKTKYLTHEEAMTTGFLSVYEKDGEWCFNTIEWGGVVPICLPDREFAIAYRAEHNKVKLALEQEMFGVRKDDDANSAQDETEQGKETDEG